MLLVDISHSSRFLASNVRKMTMPSFDLANPRPSPWPGTSVSDSSEAYPRSCHLASYLNSIGKTLGAESWVAATLKPSPADSSRLKFEPLSSPKSIDQTALQQILRNDFNDRKNIDHSGIHPTRFYATFYHEDSRRPFFSSVARIAPNTLLGIRFRLSEFLSNTNPSQVHHAEAALHALARFSGRPYHRES